MQGEDCEVMTAAQELQKVKEALEKDGLKIKEAELTFEAKDKIEINENTTKSYEKLLDVLLDHDDVVDVYDNTESD